MSERFESVVGAVPVRAPAAYSRASRYVAGQTLDEARGVARRLLRLGLAVSLDAFGELVADPAAAAEAAGAYGGADRGRRGAGRRRVGLGRPLAHRPRRLDRLLRTQLRRITERLRPGMRLQVGAEDAARCDAILDIVEEAAGRGAALTCTLQANLRRSMDDYRASRRSGSPCGW